MAPACFPGNHQPFARLVDHSDEPNGCRNCGGLIGARVVDDQEFVGLTRLRQDGMKTSWKVTRFVMRADNDGDS